jgi:hypothetical protein
MLDVVVAAVSCSLLCPQLHVVCLGLPNLAYRVWLSASSNLPSPVGGLLALAGGGVV